MHLLQRDTQIERRAVLPPGAGATCAFAQPSAHASTILDRNTNAWDAVRLRNQPRSTWRS
ncbi:hypothetical protein ABT112_30635 [Streptomyces sp. NPDC002055]|uniref:hypothetical protein n=1 Tax=Streptomyces sp. NPDC002055 TaxID=3154534 RepID=UPI003322462E